MLYIVDIHDCCFGVVVLTLGYLIAGGVILFLMTMLVDQLFLYSTLHILTGHMLLNIVFSWASFGFHGGWN